ncbi:hypothetical protein Pmani_016343 [Petrolisthes manimaculis]|uniref:Transposase n=1 Tax=Petrolisthes manimaculis TaxID=1843537 RepID=A0AAE1PSF4_9EUCA|nr:hypothetical protein Pmani_016343 [Petrolisthes manimaculis]
MKVRSYLQRQWGAQSATELNEQIAKATGVTVRTIRNIKQKAARCHPLPISSPSRAVQATISSRLDDIDKGLIRKEIVSFYDRGELPTLDLLLKKVKQPPINFSGGKTTLWSVIRKLGFKYKKVTSGRAILMERHDIVMSRNRYLRIIEKNRKSAEPRPEIYINETWVNQRESVDKCWTVGDGTVGPKIKTGKGARFIILH